MSEDNIISDTEWQKYLNDNPDIKMSIMMRQLSERAYYRQYKEIIRLKKLVGELPIDKYRYNMKILKSKNVWSDKQKEQFIKLRYSDNLDISVISDIMNLSNRNCRRLEAVCRYHMKCKGDKI